MLLSREAHLKAISFDFGNYPEFEVSFEKYNLQFEFIATAVRRFNE